MGSLGFLVFKSSRARAICYGMGAGIGIGYGWHQNNVFLKEGGLKGPLANQMISLSKGVNLDDFKKKLDGSIPEFLRIK